MSYIRLYSTVLTAVLF